MLPSGTMTYTGFAVLIIPVLADRLGIKISPEESQTLVGHIIDLINIVSLLVGSYWTIYGRYRATRNKA